MTHCRKIAQANISPFPTWQRARNQAAGEDHRDIQRRIQVDVFHQVQLQESKLWQIHSGHLVFHIEYWIELISQIEQVRLFSFNFKSKNDTLNGPLPVNFRSNADIERFLGWRIWLHQTRIPLNRRLVFHFCSSCLGKLVSNLRVFQRNQQLNQFRVCMSSVLHFEWRPIQGHCSSKDRPGECR